MNNKKVIVYVLTFMIILLNLNIVFADDTNYIQNGSFENDFSNWTIIQSDNNPLSIKTSDVNDGSKTLSYWAADNFQFTVYQTVYNLPKGKYKLSVWTQGGANQSILNLFVKDYGGDKLTQQITDTGWRDWHQWSIEFTLKTNSLTIGIDCNGNAGNWGTIDKFELVKLPSSGQIVGIKDVNITAAKANNPILPNTVDVVFDDETEGKAACIWESFDASLLLNENTTFSVYGAVYGTDIKAVANINVQPIKEVKAISPINITINDTFELPKTVQVECYNSDMIFVNVYWESMDNKINQKIGSYTVMGSIYGTDLKAGIQVNVNYKNMDLNNDTKFNIGDLAIAANYLSKGRFDSDWDSVKYADINNDGQIDTNDLKLIVQKIKGKI
ncbi:Ig-like domain-containing protein [Caldicellulosiruptoraceae bacterium PP1]